MRESRREGEGRPFETPSRLITLYQEVFRRRRKGHEDIGAIVQEEHRGARPVV